MEPAGNLDQKHHLLYTTRGSARTARVMAQASQDTGLEQMTKQT